MIDTVTRLMALADDYAFDKALAVLNLPNDGNAHLYLWPESRQALEAELTRMFTPLSDDQIAQCGVEHQMFFAKGFGAAPGSWTNEQVRTCYEFQAAFVGLARAVESEHGIGETN